MAWPESDGFDVRQGRAFPFGETRGEGEEQSRLKVQRAVAIVPPMFGPSRPARGGLQAGRRGNGRPDGVFWGALLSNAIGVSPQRGGNTVFFFCFSVCWLHS